MKKIKYRNVKRKTKSSQNHQFSWFCPICIIFLKIFSDIYEIPLSCHFPTTYFPIHLLKIWIFSYVIVILCFNFWGRINLKPSCPALDSCIFLVGHYTALGITQNSVKCGFIVIRNAMTRLGITETTCLDFSGVLPSNPKLKCKLLAMPPRFRKILPRLTAFFK